MRPLEPSNNHCLYSSGRMQFAIPYGCGLQKMGLLENTHECGLRGDLLWDMLTSRFQSRLKCCLVMNL